jgi:hypothetical protein
VRGCAVGTSTDLTSLFYEHAQDWMAGRAVVGTSTDLTSLVYEHAQDWMAGTGPAAGRTDRCVTVSKGWLPEYPVMEVWGRRR